MRFTASRAHASLSLPHLVADIVATGEGAYQLNGHFLLFLWNEQRREWHVWTDRFGTLHAYFANDGRRSALSTFFQRRLWPRRVANSTGSASPASLRKDFFRKIETHFNDVRISASGYALCL
ncbi:MAG: hypothetical protein WKF84_20705 [Pyrinomonadaceae bacterium]